MKLSALFGGGRMVQGSVRYLRDYPETSIRSVIPMVARGVSCAIPKATEKLRMGLRCSENPTPTSCCAYSAT